MIVPVPGAGPPTPAGGGAGAPAGAGRSRGPGGDGPGRPAAVPRPRSSSGAPAGGRRCARSRIRTGTACRPTRFKLVVSAFHHPGTGSRTVWLATALPRTLNEPIGGACPGNGALVSSCLILLATDPASAARAPLRSRSAALPEPPGMTESRCPATGRHQGGASSSGMTGGLRLPPQVPPKTGAGADAGGRFRTDDGREPSSSRDRSSLP